MKKVELMVIARVSPVTEIKVKVKGASYPGEAIKLAQDRTPAPLGNDIEVYTVYGTQVY